MEIRCECCNKPFSGIPALSPHLYRPYNKGCLNFYLNKYKEESNFPWRRLSDKKNRLIIRCEKCKIRCRGQRGISIHVLQHSKDCFKYYVEKYGDDRRYWSENTFLNFKVCEDCGKTLKDPRSKTYCSYCRQNLHNVMKIPEVIQKNIETNKPIRESLEFRKNLSKQRKKWLLTKDGKNFKKTQKSYMLNGGALKARKGIRSPSKPELKLRKIVKELYPNCKAPFDILNYEVDMVIPDLMVVIESDGSYFHQNKKYDLKRQKRIEKLGWRFIRYVADSIKDVPSLDQIKGDVEKLLNDNKTRRKSNSNSN